LGHYSNGANIASNSLSVGHTYAMIVHNSWAALIMVYIFPVIFIIGLIMLLVGLFKKGQKHLGARKSQ